VITHQVLPLAASSALQQPLVSPRRSHTVALNVVICCHSCAYAYSCVWLVQGWEDVDGAALQLCAACNMPWLDTSFQLAPDAEMDSGMYLYEMYLARLCVQTLQIASATQLDCKIAAVPLVIVVLLLSLLLCINITLL